MIERDYKREIKALKATINNKNQQIKKKNSKIEELKIDILELSSKMVDIRKELSIKEATIRHLQLEHERI